MQSGCCLEGSCERDFEPDVKTVFGEIGSYPSPVRLNQFLDDRKADTGTAQLPRTGFFYSVKPLENEWQVVRRQIAACIAVGYTDFPVLGLELDR